MENKENKKYGFSDLVVLDLESEKNKKLIDGFIDKLKKDNFLVYDKQKKEWNVKDVYYGHLFADYCLNKLNNNIEKIDYDKHIVFDEFIGCRDVNYFIFGKDLITFAKDWYVDYIKGNIKSNLDDILEMDSFYGIKREKDEIPNWFYYHNFKCRVKFDLAINDLKDNGFNFNIFDGSKELNDKYISEMFIEPIEKSSKDDTTEWNFGYRIYSKLVSKNKKESCKINETYYNGEVKDKSKNEFLRKEKHWKKWRKFKTKNDVILIKSTHNFINQQMKSFVGEMTWSKKLDSPILTGRGRLEQWLKDNNIDIKENNKTIKKKNIERER